MPTEASPKLHPRSSAFVETEWMKMELTLYEDAVKRVFPIAEDSAFHAQETGAPYLALGDRSRITEHMRNLRARISLLDTFQERYEKSEAESSKEVLDAVNQG